MRIILIAIMASLLFTADLRHLVRLYIHRFKYRTLVLDMIIDGVFKGKTVLNV